MNCRNWLRRVFLLGAMSGIPGVVVCFGDVVVQETQIGPMPSDSRQLAVTPDGHHAALVGTGGSRPAVYIDGRAGPPYSTISPWSSLESGKPPPAVLAWSPDNVVIAYVASKADQFVVVENQHEGAPFDGIQGAAFSPVGHRLVYVARKGLQNTATNPMQFYVVADGRTGPAYRSVRAVQFSADGQHIGYFATTASGALPNHVVFDGHEGPGFGNIGDLHLSPGGGHYAYVGDTLRTNQIDKAVIVDGSPGPAYDAVRGIVFSTEGNHVAYFASKTRVMPQSQSRVVWTAVIDGKAGPEFQDLPNSSVVFSPDGQRTAYAGKAVAGAHWRTFAVIDGAKSIDYDECSNFMFSADGRHIAYLATNSGKSVVVLDGQESDAHQSIDPFSMRFSADGSRFGFVAQDESTWRVVVDGKPGAPRRDLIDGKSLEFSPDGQHYRFKIRNSSGDWNFVVDDHAESSASPPSKMAMTSDWRHSATVVRAFPGDSYHEALARQSGQPTGLIVALDGKTVGSDYEYVDLLEISADGRRVAYTISKREEAGKNSYHIVIDGREAATGYFRITKMLFSPDSQHVAYVAWADGSKQSVVIDGFAGPVFDAILGSPNEQPGAIQFRPDGSLDYYAVKGGKLVHVMFDAATIAALPKPAAGGAPAAGYAEIYAFGSVAKDGSKPAVLAAAPDGTLFGATSAGGQFRYGVIFKVQPDGTGYTILHQILGPQNDGSYPSTMLVGRDGALYGTYTVASANGAVFRCSADGSDYRFLRAASGDTDVGEPKLLGMDADGNFIGVSGATTTTRLFRLSPNGEFTKLHQAPSSTYNNNYEGIGPAVDGRDGYIYGVYAQSIFKVKQDGAGYAVIRKFSGPPLDGSGGDHAPILGSDGRLYGTATGGQAGGGVVYAIGRDGGGYRVILNPESERLLPKELLEGPDGKLYALVAKGVARFNKDGSDFSIVQPTDGGNFVATAMVKGDAIYGVRYSGGAKGNGLVFRYGLGAAAATAAPAIVIKEVPAAPLPPLDQGTNPSVSGAGSGPAEANNDGMETMSPATPPNNAVAAAPAQSETPNPQPIAPPPASPAQPAGSATVSHDGTAAQNAPVDAAQATMQKVEAVGSQVGAAATKAKAKAEQAAAKAKNWLESLRHKKP